MVDPLLIIVFEPKRKLPTSGTTILRLSPSVIGKKCFATKQQPPIGREVSSFQGHIKAGDRFGAANVMRHGTLELTAGLPEIADGKPLKRSF